MNHPIQPAVTGQPQVSAGRLALRDVQPILERRSNSIWARVEQTRDAICDALRQACEQEGFDALVIKSAPFVHPATVTVEGWVPKRPELGRAVTERGLLVLTIEAKEFHRYELEYTVKLHDRGWSKTYLRLYSFGLENVVQAVRFLLSRGPRPRLAGYRLRNMPFELWKPRNKVNVLRMDWLKLAPVILIVLGLGLFSVGIGVLFLIGAGVVYYLLRRRRAVVLSSGKPVAEPRELRIVDTWQTVIPGLGADTELLRERFFAVLQNPSMDGLRWRVERIWYWGLDGKEEREQIVLTFRRAIFFCHIYRYGQELYVGWDAHLNEAQWVEKTVATGIHKQSGEFTRVNTVEQGSQKLSEYDLTDVNCLIEWAHAKLVQLVKRLMEERQIDQEIDFTILRGDRQDLTRSAPSGRGDRQNPTRTAPAGEGIQQAARRVTRKLVRMQ